MFAAPQLMSRYEAAGVSLQPFQPMVWGSAALSFYSPTQVTPAASSARRLSKETSECLTQISINMIVLFYFVRSFIVRLPSSYASRPTGSALHVSEPD